MKTLFTQYLFLLFLSPILVIILSFIFLDGEIEEVGYNRTVSWNFVDAYFGNPIYNWSAFLGSYAVFFFAYLVVVLIGRRTDFSWSVVHFSSFMLNFVLISLNAENRFLLPLSIICFVFFILNIFKTSKKLNN